MDAATLNAIIFIMGFLAIVITGELLEAYTRQQRCTALLGIVMIAAAAMRPAAPTSHSPVAVADTQT